MKQKLTMILNQYYSNRHFKIISTSKKNYIIDFTEISFLQGKILKELYKLSNIDFIDIIGDNEKEKYKIIIFLK